MLVDLFKNLLTKKQTPSSIEHALGYRFKNKHYLTAALTHKSLCSDCSDNYERLEFLGDSILESVLTDWLFREYPDSDEGYLTNRRASLVNKCFLSIVACKLKINRNIRVDKSVNLDDKKVMNNLVADVYEALIGAIFLDGGFRAARRVILETIIENAHYANYENNYKGRLIEYCHKNQFDGPRFLHRIPAGPEHEKIFNVELKLGKDKIFFGNGKSKKEAEQEAAKRALEHLC
ncbi:MAG: ribonuclease III [Fidelibacterota bacterium]